MVINNFAEKLNFKDISNVVKKKIWKQALKEVKQLKNGMQAKNAKQILFYYKFGSTKKRKGIT
jgi:hypothetical protein